MLNNDLLISLAPKVFDSLKLMVDCVSEEDDFNHMLDPHDPEGCVLCEARALIDLIEGNNG